jgi:hypothetical protein
VARATVHPDQLDFGEQLRAVVEQLGPGHAAGPRALLIALVRRGLAERDLRVAAMLVLEADLEAAERRRGAL